MFAMNPMHESEASKLRKDLEAAKLREAEQASALEIARGSLETCAGIFKSLRPFVDEQNALTSGPSAALAERDRAIREECIQTYYAVYSDMVHSEIPFHITADFLPKVAAILRAVNLEPKPEEKPQSRPVCPKCECCTDTLEGITPGCHCVCHD